MQLISQRILTRLRDRRGFTLVETLVAMVTGVVVTGALFAILEFSVKQTGRLSEVTQATQVSGTAMTHIVDALQSSCLYAGFAPVQAESGPSKLVFVNAYFPEANEKKEAEYKFVRKDTVEYTSSGTLTDKLYQATGEEKEGAFPWKEVRTTTLAEGISHVNTETAVPVFKYYEYGEASTTNTTQAAATLQEIKVTKELSAEQAKRVASVGISFRTAPYRKEAVLSKTSEQGTPVDLNSQTTFAFSAPNSETPINAGPCE